MLRFVRWLASKLPRRDVYGNAGIYLSRYTVFGWQPGNDRHFPFSVYIHHFHRPDEDPDCPHSHPWAWARALILSGGYVERRLLPDGSETERVIVAGQVNAIHADTFHVVTRVLGETWTLLIVGPKTQSWGFHVPGRGFVPWRERIAERGLEADY